MKAKLSRILAALRDLKHLQNRTKPGFLIFLQIMGFMIRNRGKFKVFFLMRLHERGRNAHDFISERKYAKLDPLIAPHYFRVLLENKIVFYRYLKGLGKSAHLPETLGYLTRDHFYLPDETTRLPISGIQKLEHESFVKEASGYCGQNIFKLSTHQNTLLINGRESDLENLSRSVKDISIVQKKVEQHDDLSKIYSHSLNTMRIISCHNRQEYKVYSTILRTGRGGSFIDNTSAGNIMVGVDRDTGKLHKYAWSLTSLRDMYLTSHPDTGFIFEAYPIPFFEEAKALCLSLHPFFPDFFLLGWDVAFTPDGPLIVECNNLDSILSTQIVSGGIKKKFMEDLKLFLAR